MKKAGNKRPHAVWLHLYEMCRIGISMEEKAMAPHSSTVARKNPWMEEPGRLQSMGSLTVRHYWTTSLSLSTFMHWRRKWQPTPMFLPGESHGWRRLVGCSPWGCTESDTTEATQQQQQQHNREKKGKSHIKILKKKKKKKLRKENYNINFMNFCEKTTV